jgi:hypothetical protein
MPGKNNETNAKNVDVDSGSLAARMWQVDTKGIEKF